MDNLLLENADLHLFLQRTESGDGTRASGLTKGDHGGMGRGSGGGPTPPARSRPLDGAASEGHLSQQ